MALQSSGQITLSEIWSEYNSGATPGANENISLGTLSTNTADGGGDPDAMSEFYGLSSAPALVANENFTISTYTGNGSTLSVTSPTVGQAASFNGSSSKIVLPNNANIGPVNNFSISFWAKNDDITQDNQMPYSLQAPTAGRQFMQLSVPTVGGDGALRIYNTLTGNIYISNAMQSGVWHHIVLTKSSTTGLIVYIDNVARLTRSGDTANIGIYTGFSTDSNRIGAYKTTTESNWWNGDIDDFRIYNDVLSSAEVEYIYNNDTSNIPTSNLVAHYKLDGNANDAQGSYNGTATNVTYTSNAAISNIGFLGQAADFNASVSSKIDTGINLSTYEDDYSMSFWFKMTSFNSSFRGVLGTTTQSSNYSDGLIVDQGLNGEMRWRFRKSGSSYNLISTGTYTDGEWHHAVGIKDGTTIKLYIDGNAEILTGSVATGITHNTTLRIGTVGLVTSASVFALDGSIGDFRLYNDVLTAQEVLNIYNNTSIPTDNLIAHYKFNGNANDEQGNFNGTANDVGWVGSNFKPDLVWIKNQDETTNHSLYDVLRRPLYFINSNTTSAEGTAADLLTSFDSTGFTVGSHVSNNKSGIDYVAWMWKAGGAGVSNTDGSVTSTVSANQSAGFSVVEFTTSGGTGTVGHGLSQAPEVVLMKRTSTTSDWYFFTTAIDGSMDLLKLNTTGAQQANANQTITSTTFKDWASSGTFIAYCFHSINGYQRFTTYTGNGSFTGPIVYLDSNGDNTGTGGFKPRWVMIKRTDDVGNWVILDHLRKDGSAGNNSASNPDAISDFLEPNTSDTQTTGQFERIELLNNGFQVVNTAGYLNASGGTYLAWAIA